MNAVEQALADGGKLNFKVQSFHYRDEAGTGITAAYFIAHLVTADKKKTVTEPCKTLNGALSVLVGLLGAEEQMNK